MLTASRGGATMSLTYDKAGRKLTMDDPDMGDWSYVYNALGGMTRQVDAKNQVTCLYYDELNRPRGKDYFTNSAACPADPGSGYDVGYGYDSMANGNFGKGRRTSMVDGSGSATWIYDARGRVTKETKVISSVSFVTEWTLYNSADLPVTMKYPDGEEVTTTYDNNMLPKTTIGNATYVSNTNYDSAGRMTSRALGNGLTQNYTYYPWNQQGGRLNTLSTGTLQNLAYQYDSVGNITQIANSVASETSVYDYDALDRLTSWTLNQDSPETYTYDTAGRLDQKGSMDLQYLDSNHVHAVTNANSNTYAYDNNGNQITRHIGSDTFDLAYDAENRLVEVKKNNVIISQFTYDGDGKRVKSVIDGETILFAGGHYEKKGSTISKYYFAGATRIAMRKYTIPQNMTVEYFLSDHLGSTSITTDNAGVKVSEMRYKPWGELRYSWTNAPANTSPTYELTKYQFTGQYSYNTEFGLMFYGARFYDSAIGRFVSADTMIPGGTQGYDRYAYVYNNPLRYNDPTGHFAQLLAGFVIGAVVGVLITAATVPNATREDLVKAAVVGAAAGTLISSGIGFGAGTALGATLIGAGAGAATSAAAYTVTAGDSYNSEEMGANALIGAATGAATALTGPAVVGTNIARSGAAMFLRAGINAAGTEVSQIVHNEYFDEGSSYPPAAELAGGAMLGATGSYVGEGADWLVTTLTGSPVAGSLAYQATKNFVVGTQINQATNWIDCVDEGTCE